jgi:hypothetical protein
MDREEILRKIEEIRAEVEKDQLKTLRSRILERRFHLHGSHRNRFSRLFLEKFRKRLILEMSLILRPILDNQRDINLRFLKEIERLKEAVSPGRPGESDKGKDAQRPAD